MANPNKTAAGFKPEVRETPEARATRVRSMSPSLFDIMDAVSRGVMTPEEGAAAVAKLVGADRL